MNGSLGATLPWTEPVQARLHPTLEAAVRRGLEGKPRDQALVVSAGLLQQLLAELDAAREARRAGLN